MELEYLSWDSVFFKRKIGRFLIGNFCDLHTVLEEAKSENFQLIYVFGNKDFFVDKKTLDCFNGRLVDRKVLYEKDIENEQKRSTFTSEYIGNLTSDLEKLAYLSGKFSRFKLDNNFHELDFYRMYKIWIQESVKRQIADNVFVTKEKNIVKGMVTLKISNEKGIIGLLAVAPDTQRKGYGKALISACENELLRKGVLTLGVSTQLDNIQGCNFYEKCGFRVKEINNIYHFWL